MCRRKWSFSSRICASSFATVRLGIGQRLHSRLRREDLDARLPGVFTTVIAAAPGDRVTG